MAPFKSLLAALLFANLPSLAQTMVGIQAGINWSDLHWTELRANTYGTGSAPTAGFVLQSDLANNLFLVTGLAYSRRMIPWVDLQYLESSSSSVEFRYQYTQICASLKRSFDFGEMHPYLIGGAIYDYLASASLLDSRFGGQTQVIDMLQQWRIDNFALSGGVGLDYNISQSVVLFTDLRYSGDVTNMSRNPVIKVHMTSYQVTGGVLFGL